MTKYFILILTLTATLGVHAAEMMLTLDEAILTARIHSVNAAVALDELRTAYWEWRTYRADRLPEIDFTATAPSYANRYSSYMDGDGEYSFVRNRYLDAQARVSVIQNITLTGGQLSLSSSLDLLHQYGGDGGNRFMTIPVALTLTQPILGVNTMRWNSRIEPVKFAEAKAAFLSATEDVALATVNYFFTLIMSRENLSIAEQNLANAEKLYAVAVEKRAMGQISENDLLQMELNLLDARSDLTDRESNLKNAMFSLRAFLGYGEDTEIVPQVPGEVPHIDITYADALDKALANNKFARNVRRRQLEADYEVAKAKGNLRQINLFAQVGYTGTSNEAGRAYRDLRANQVVEVGIKIPLLDWGKRRGNVKVAESNRRVVESRLRQETLSFNQDLFILVERFCNQQMQLDIAQRADTITRRRYDTNVETFLIGRISTLDLNDSQVKKDQARQNMVNELYLYWYYFYQLRSLTLWDYTLGRNIDADIERLVR